MKNGNLYKTFNGGFNWEDDESIFTWIMHYNPDGTYRGQTQSDMMGEGDIFMSANMIDGVPHINGHPAASLTQEEMASAK